MKSVNFVKKIEQRFEVRMCVGLALVMVECGFYVGVCLLCSSVFLGLERVDERREELSRRLALMIGAW